MHCFGRKLLRAGTPIGAIGILSDVAEQGRLERQQGRLGRMEALGRLVGEIAHDFNNLVLVINNYSDLLLEQVGHGDPLRSDIEQLSKATVRAAKLAQQLLAFSRGQTPKPQLVNLNHVIRDMSPMLRRLLGRAVCAGDLARSRSGRGESGSGASRAGSDEPRRQRARCHARRRDTQNHDLQPER